ncbi:unnamed protein product [Callosobruchus maculatus]|uniref:Uncharacterized protein n=1 Tax=Callosobruchus maculatus TaxID=64391 RepID=A0A653BJB7_CALMS|nr:unnamed protein product [Callosobruchus maculatus]
MGNVVGLLCTCFFILSISINPNFFNRTASSTEGKT